MQLINSHNLFHRLEIGGVSHTALDTGIASNGPGMTKIRNAVTGAAMRIVPEQDGFSTSPVDVDQILSLDGRIHLVLKGYFNGHTLRDYIDYRQDFSGETASLFALLFRIYRHQPELLPVNLNPHHILHCEDGTLLILPEAWSLLLSANESEESLDSGQRRLTFPDTTMFEPWRVRLYALVNALYFMITRRWPYPGDDLESYRRYQRRNLAMPVELIYPDMDADLARWINASLQMEADGLAEDIEDQLRKLGERRPHIPGDGLPEYRRPRDPEDRKREPANFAFYRRQLQRERVFAWVKRRSLPLVIAASVLIVAVAGTITTVQNLTADLLITGLEPAEVVREFYESFNRLDHEFMSQATAGRAGQGAISRISNMYVVSTIREGTEMRSVFMNAEQWLSLPEDQRPSLTDRLVFGLGDLEIRETDRMTDADGNPLIEYEATYVLWDPDPEEDLLLENDYRDRLVLKEFRRGWKIVELTSLDL
jgi:hypothetical protein